MNHKTIVICPGPEYLFWSSGVYYCAELSKKYNIILVADHYISDELKIEKLISSGVVCKFYQYPISNSGKSRIRKLLNRHLHFFQLSKNLFKNNDIDFIIQHTDLEVANIYIYSEGAKYGIPGIMYRPTTIAKNYYQDYKFSISWAIKFQKIAEINLHLARYTFNLSKIFRYLLNYFIIPFIVTGNIFRPRIRMFPTKDKYFNDNPAYYSYAIIHTLREADIAKENGEPSILVKNPLSITVKSIAKLLDFDDFYREVGVVLMLPTSGEYDWYITQNNSDPTKFFQIWINVLRIFREKFPGYRIILKCHPMATDEHIYKRILEESKITNFEVIERSYTVEKLILKSEVIIGTTTSSLWWATQIGLNKQIYSLDIFGLGGGDRYSHATGMIYVDEIDIIAIKEIAQSAVEENNSIQLTEFISQIT